MATAPPTPDAAPAPSAALELHGKSAVLEALPENAAVIALASLATDAKFDRDELTITVARENILAACESLKAASFTFFEDLTAVDWYPQEPRFQLSLPHSLDGPEAAHSPRRPAQLGRRIDRIDHPGVALRELLRARGLRPLRQSTSPATRALRAS